MSGKVTALALLAVVLAIPLGLLAGTGSVPGHILVMFVAFTGLAYLIALRIAGPEESWLPTLMLWGMIAKLAGATVRHLVLFDVYSGGGDAVTYHRVGIEIANVWRTFVVPSIESAGSGSFGTHFVGWLTGLIYTPFEPSSLGGFWIFSFFAFLGQVLLYLAFRSFTSPPGWRRYAFLVFFWPTLLYWPSSIGKEALLLLFIGITAWGAAKLYRRFRFAWLIPIAGAAAIIGFIRVHVAALLVGSILAGALLARGPRRDIGAGLRRILLVALGIAAMFPLVLSVANQFGVSLNGPISIEDLDPAFSTIETRTAQGGSAVQTGAIRSPADIPGGVLKVLFRPLPTEASNLQTLAASVESVLLILLILWRVPKFPRNTRRLLRWPYLMMCLVYTLGFIFAWSAINNLGIIARQRSLLLPFLLAIIVALGWNDSVDDHAAHDLTARLMAPGSPATGAGRPPRRGDRAELAGRTSETRR